MKRHVKVQIKRMLLTTWQGLRTEGLALLRMLGREIGTIGREFLRAVWEGLSGPQKPVRRRGRGRSW